MLGSTNILLKTKDTTVPTQALVTTNLAHPVLLSWHNMMNLGLISQTFPSAIEASVGEVGNPEQVPKSV